MNTAQKFYIAGSFKDIPLINQIAFRLTTAGFTCTYDWTVNREPVTLDDLHDIADKEYTGIAACDYFVFVFPGGKGANIEFGIATALGKPIYLYDPTRATETPATTSTFYRMDHVHRYHGSVAEFAQFILNNESNSTTK